MSGKTFCTCRWTFLKLLFFLPNYLLEICHGCCGKNFLIFICLKIPWQNLELLNLVAFSKLFSTVELCLLAWKVGFAENQTSLSLLNQLNVSWFEILTHNDQMQPVFKFIHFWPKLLPQCTLPQSVKYCLNQCQSIDLAMI